MQRAAAWIERKIFTQWEGTSGLTTVEAESSNVFWCNMVQKRDRGTQETAALHSRRIFVHNWPVESGGRLEKREVSARTRAAVMETGIHIVEKKG